ncbi:suppressor of fused domain protein [Kribbella sp. CA-294648]|uniref:suppressor of fused domain protein n=1 Tax=Kribbella sp. CA-294648 TaxID=3239948 RepID=UPI003D93FEE5
MDDGDREAPGWDAIEAAVAKVVPTQEPLHWGTETLPGQDGIYGLSAYVVDSHWLLITFGLTELFAKDSDDLLTSGWGFELTLRVPADDDQPPEWALRLLRQLGAYVFSTGQPFAPGHRMDPGGPITGTPDTRLTALAFADDPQLAPIDTPHGAVGFLTVVGITADELALMKATTTADVITQLSASSPLLITDPRR